MEDRGPEEERPGTKDEGKAEYRVTIRPFAARHGLSPETRRREYLRDATGAAVPDPGDRRRRRYAEHDPFAAQRIPCLSTWHGLVGAGDVGSGTGRGSRPSPGATSTTRAPAPRGRRGPSRTATGSCADGIRRGRTSRSARARTCADSRTSSTRSTAGCSAERPHMNTTPPMQTQPETVASGRGASRGTSRHQAGPTRMKGKPR